MKQRRNFHNSLDELFVTVKYIARSERTAANCARDVSKLLWVHLRKDERERLSEIGDTQEGHDWRLLSQSKVPVIIGFPQEQRR